MLLSINPKKVEEQLRDNTLPYVVSPCNWEGEKVGPQLPVSNSTTDLVFDFSPEAERYRNRVLLIRRTIAEKGGQMASSPEELEHLLDETRGRR